MAENDLLISLDKLPIKRIDAIEESGLERFPPDLSYDEKTVNLIRRIDFTWAVERDAKKQKKKTKAKESSGPSMWQGLIENLQLARQEIQVIVDLIATVEANDAVAVAVMNRPKPLPNEALSDLAVSTATKLQCYRHLGKYFKQSAKALEHQIAREARFYGALIRLQKNWKVKRHRLAANAPGSEGFLIDLSDNSMHESAILTRPPAFSMVRVDHDSTGMLAVNIPKSSCRSFCFGFLDVQSSKHSEDSEEMDFIGAKESPKETVKDSLSDDDRVRETNTVLCDAHRAIFYELVFELISRESFNPSLGFSVTGIRENYLELSLKPGVSAFISLEPYDTQDHAGKSKDAQDTEEVSYGASLMEVKSDKKIEYGRPNHTTYEIYLEQLFHSEIFSKGKPQPTLPGRAQPIVQTKDDEGLVTHFCLSLSHRIFSSKVLMELESLVTKVSYLQLITQPTWHSRTSSWTLYVKVPESILDARSQACRSDDLQLKKSLFQTRVVVKDDSISIEGGGAPNVVGLFKGDLEAMSFKGRFNCDLVDLPMVLLLQVASQIISWLHEEASIVGIKTNLDFLSISWELDQGETLSLIAHVDPEDPLGCISWWLILDDSPTEDRKFPAELADGDSSTRRFLGYLALDTLYSTLMDLVSVCTGSVSH
ncbi:mediator of RNA polymerase II transcription subunit 17 [Silene latifolia]|uniref:mediator of RNA polymerase II transcription subunit 17 n=1 Tax=Silene latifolia TaxID=37657 RepID=UPI003D76A84C